MHWRFVAFLSSTARGERFFIANENPFVEPRRGNVSDSSLALFLLFPIVQRFNNSAGYVVGKEVHRLGIDRRDLRAIASDSKSFLQSRHYLSGK